MELDWPFEPYQIQERTLAFIKESTKKYVMVEMPTGLGKTITLLMAALPEALEKKCRIEYYFTSHEQAATVIKEVRLINQANPKIQPIRVVHLAGRAFMCNKSSVKEIYDESERVRICNELVKLMDPDCVGRNAVKMHVIDGKPIRYIDREAKKRMLDELRKRVLSKPVLSVDDINEIGSDMGICPRKVMNVAIYYATILTMPKTYLFIPWEKIHGRNIIIIDESHSIDSDCLGNNEVVLGNKTRRAITKETKQKWSNTDIRDGVLKERHVGVSVDLGEDKMDEELRNETVCFLSWIEELETGDLQEALGKCPLSRTKVYDLGADLGSHAEEIYSAYADLEEETGADIPSHFGTFQEFTRRLGDAIDRPDRHVIVKTPTKFQLKQTPALGPEELKKGAMIKVRGLDPSIIFETVTYEARRVILASGTLNPGFMSQLLGIVDDCDYVELESIHENVMGHYIKEINGEVLNTSYKSRGDAMYTRFALAILNIVNHSGATGGTLVFTPNYSMARILYSLEFLPEGQRDWGVKTFFGKDDLHTFKRYTRSGKGIGKKAIFFSAYRGSGSEGINFPDEECRTTILCGVPFINTISDSETKAQYEYYIKKYNEGFANVWLIREAAVPMGQAWGRGNRSLTDYSIIWVLSSRFKAVAEMLPLWVRQSINWVDPHDESRLTLSVALELSKAFYDNLRNKEEYHLTDGYGIDFSSIQSFE